MRSLALIGSEPPSRGSTPRETVATVAIGISWPVSACFRAEPSHTATRPSTSPATSTELVDECADGALRYVLEGTGSVCADGDEPVAVAVNTLVRVDGATTLRWVPDDELVLLTPEYKGPNLLPFAAGHGNKTYHQHEEAGGG